KSGGELPEGILGEPPAEPRRGYLSTAVGLWWLVPVGAAAEMLTGWAPGCIFIQLDYNLRLNWGEAAAGLLSGYFRAEANPQSPFQYGIEAFPIAGNLRISGRSAGRVRLIGEVALGVAINNIAGFNFDKAPLTVTKPFLAATLGLGLRLTEHFHLNAQGRFAAIFFDNSCLTGLSPEISVVFRF
ncbi:MAG: hypothetical protein JW820_18050, partial [Spirochaetales bacterium]|nr:hypothetical protein [Spirochaetales bacterium]